jgi:hypothetical protein
MLNVDVYAAHRYSAGRHTPGTFTNQIQKVFEEPRLLLVTDPRCAAAAGSTSLSKMQRGQACKGCTLTLPACMPHAATHDGMHASMCAWAVSAQHQAFNMCHPLHCSMQD